MDDEDTIAASAVWKTVEGSPTAGRPLVMATLAANHELNSVLDVDQRRDPDGRHKTLSYRLFNVFLHLLSGALLFGVVRRGISERSIPDDWQAMAAPLAGTVCALWMLHPIQSEVINYIVQRSEALASLSYLATLYASQRAWQAVPSTRVRWYAVAVVACVLGMLSKEIVVSAPLAVMLYDRAFRLPRWRDLLRPGSGRGWFYVALWTACVASFIAFEAGARGGTAGFSGDIRWYDYLYTQCWAIAHYLRLVVWPFGLSVDYGVNAIHGLRGIPGLVLLSTFAAVTLVAWKRVEKFGWLAFLGSWFFMLLAPSSSVVPITSEVAAERRIYLALAAVLIVAVVSVEALRRRFSPGTPSRRLGAMFVGIAIALTIVTARRSNDYATAETLWRGAVQAVPDNPRALGNLGWALLRLPAPRLAESESVFTRAMAQDSTCRFTCVQYATLLATTGRPHDAAPLLEKATARNAGNLRAERLLALVLIQSGEYGRAIPHLEVVAARFPTEDHLAVLGVAYLSAGRRDEALATLRRVGSVDGGAPAMQRLSRTLEEAARHPEALPALQDFALKQANAWM